MDNKREQNPALEAKLKQATDSFSKRMRQASELGKDDFSKKLKSNVDNNNYIAKRFGKSRKSITGQDVPHDPVGRDIEKKNNKPK